MGADGDGLPTRTKSETLTIRLSSEARERLDDARLLGPYEISITAIVERGIELAAREIERIRADVQERKP